MLGAEAALGRIQFVSGTHAIATALYSVLRPGDELLAVAGRCDHSASLLVVTYRRFTVLHHIQAL